MTGDVQIIFDGCNEYNLYIDVCGGRYEAVHHGLDLVEQEPIDEKLESFH